MGGTTKCRFAKVKGELGVRSMTSLRNRGL